jgi:hypothetical protein
LWYKAGWSGSNFRDSTKYDHGPAAATILVETIHLSVKSWRRNVDLFMPLKKHFIFLPACLQQQAMYFVSAPHPSWKECFLVTVKSLSLISDKYSSDMLSQAMSARSLGASHSGAIPAPDGMAIVTGTLSGSPHSRDMWHPCLCRVALQAAGPPSGPCRHGASGASIPYGDTLYFYIWLVSREPWDSKHSSCFRLGSWALLPSMDVKCLGEGLLCPSPLTSIY